MHKFLCQQGENHLNKGNALLLHRFLAHSPPCPAVRPQRMYSFTPQLREQLSFAIRLVNGIHCSLGDKVLLHLMVDSKTSPSNIKDGNLEGTLQLFRIPQTPRPPKSPLRLFANPSAALSSLSLSTPCLGWDGTILLDLSCNFRVATKSLWLVLRN